MTELLDRLLGGDHLREDEASDVCVRMACDGVPPALSGAVLAALRAKGETAEELRGFARAMRSMATVPDLPRVEGAVDIVGTGGDGSHSVNISTGATLLTAACGVPVVKHGNRSVSSHCGSADVLEALGLPMPLDAEAAARCLDRTGFTFLFAPHYHPAMAAIAPVRRALGVRTVFNMLGPLTNPAAPPFAVVGAYSVAAAELLAGALSAMPIERAFVVHGDNGWDEPTPVSPFTLFDVRGGSVLRERRDALVAGVPRCTDRDLLGGDAETNAALLRAALCDADPPSTAVRDALVVGAALALEVSGRVSSLRDGVECARSAIRSGAAARIVSQLREVRE